MYNQVQVSLGQLSVGRFIFPENLARFWIWSLTCCGFKSRQDMHVIPPGSRKDDGPGTLGNLKLLGSRPPLCPGGKFPGPPECQPNFLRAPQGSRADKTVDCGIATLAGPNLLITRGCPLPKERPRTAGGNYGNTKNLVALIGWKVYYFRRIFTRLQQRHYTK